jgi:ubiquinol-cytochrome c reductase cytochrome b subunit
LDEYHQYKLVNYESPEVLPAQPNAEGKITKSEKARGVLSRIFFEDRVAPPTPAEVEAAHAHGGHGEVEAEHADHESISHR